MQHKPEMPIHKASKFIVANANLQLSGQECAIPYMIGSPGIGKTAYINKIGKKAGFELLPFHFSLVPIEEISGIPKFKTIEFDGREVAGTEWTLPDIMTKIYNYANNHKKVLIFLDDYHMSSPSHLALGFELFTERKLRGYSIPDNCAFVLAGNDTVKSGAKQMFGAIVNRFSSYKVVPDFNHWEQDYAIPNGINNKITTFLKNKVNQQFFLEEESTIDPWASPRSWSRFSNLLNAMETINFTDEELLYNCYAHVGGKAASEFVAYYNIYSKTEMDKVFDDKIKVRVPESNTDVYIYAMAAANEYANRTLNNDSNDKAVKTKVTDKIAEIIIEIAKQNIDISVALFQSIQDYASALQRKDNLGIRDILTTMPKLDKEIDKRITNSISDIIRAKAPR